jgi:hypothetical protein
MVFAALNAPLEEFTPTALARLGLLFAFYLSVATDSVVAGAAITASIQPGSAIVRVRIAGGSTAGSLLVARLVADFRARILLKLGPYEILDLSMEQITRAPTLLPSTAAPSIFPTDGPTTAEPSQQPVRLTLSPTNRPSAASTSPRACRASLPQVCRRLWPRQARAESRLTSPSRQARARRLVTGALRAGWARCLQLCRGTRGLVSLLQSPERSIRSDPPLLAS